MRILVCLAAGVAMLSAQEFDAASVKPAAPPTQGMMRIGMRGGPGSNDPGRINYTNVALKELLTTAYDVKSHQISGPSWLDSERFDITATMPPGTTKAQFHLMLQKLLAERFKLTLHHESKELPAFVLTVGKKGSKLKPSAEDVPAKEGEEPAPAAMGRGPMKAGKDGFPEMTGGGRRGGGPMVMITPGKAKMVGEKTSMEQFTTQIERFLNRPVVDKTELTGKYDFALYFTPDMANMPAPPVGVGGLGEHGTEQAEIYPPLAVAIQEQLGLKLDSQKTQVDILVIDHLEKVPTEN
jgi:uncharacterized protein (TIGR03435 family)